MGAVTSCADRLKSLADCSDIASLRSAVRDLCAAFGNVTQIDVFTIAEEKRRRALCLLRLESIAQEQRLLASLSASRFGDAILIVVDLPPGSPLPLS